MNYRSGLFLLLLITNTLLGRPTAASGGSMLFEQMDPDVSYSAWRHVETREGSTRMREFHAPGKRRMEMSAEGQNMVMIIHSETGEGWMLIPRARMYMETTAGKMSQRAGGEFEVLEQTEIGKEKVNGYATTKYKGIFRDHQGRKGGGYFWLTDAHGIPIKSDIVQKTAQGKQRIVMELTDLQVGSQDAALFAVPDSYQAMPGNMGGMMNNLFAGQVGGGQSGGGDARADYMEQLERQQAQKAQEKQARIKSEAALSQLTADYLKDQCWFDREGQIKVNPDGSYSLGLRAGDGYAMQSAGDTIDEFRARYDGLASKSPDRFVVLSHGREFAFERRPCVGVSHSIAGSGSASGAASQRDADNSKEGDEGVLDKAGENVKKATDKLKKGIGSLFD